MDRPSPISRRQGYGGQVISGGFLLNIEVIMKNRIFVPIMFSLCAIMASDLMAMRPNRVNMFTRPGVLQAIADGVFDGKDREYFEGRRCLSRTFQMGKFPEDIVREFFDAYDIAIFMPDEKTLRQEIQDQDSEVCDAILSLTRKIIERNAEEADKKWKELEAKKAKVKSEAKGTCVLFARFAEIRKGRLGLAQRTIEIEDCNERVRQGKKAQQDREGRERTVTFREQVENVKTTLRESRSSNVTEEFLNEAFGRSAVCVALNELDNEGFRYNLVFSGSDEDYDGQQASAAMAHSEFGCNGYNINRRERLCEDHRADGPAVQRDEDATVREVADQILSAADRQEALVALSAIYRPQVIEKAKMQAAQTESFRS